MRHLPILNDPPCGTERSVSRVRMAHALARHDSGGEVTVVPLADAVLCAKAGQKTPDGCYDIECRIGRVVPAGGRVRMCGTCMDARGQRRCYRAVGIPGADAHGSIVEQSGPSARSAQLRDGSRMSALPTRQTIMPAMSQRSGRLPSTSQSQSIEPAM